MQKGQKLPPKQRLRIEVAQNTLDELKTTAAILAAGRAGQGLLSNPALGGLALAAILGVITASAGKDVADAFTKWFAGLQGILDAETPEEKSVAVNRTADGLRALIRALSPLGPLTPLP